jgi:hypothetical protein
MKGYDRHSVHTAISGNLSYRVGQMKPTCGDNHSMYVPSIFHPHRTIVLLMCQVAGKTIVLSSYVFGCLDLDSMTQIGLGK